MSDATPRPWAEHGKGGCPCGQIFGPDGNVVVCIALGPNHLNWADCVPNGKAPIENAALIVRSVNAHDALVAALKLAVGYVEKIQGITTRAIGSDNIVKLDLDVINAALKLAGEP